MAGSNRLLGCGRLPVLCGAGEPTFLLLRDRLSDDARRVLRLDSCGQGVVSYL